MVRCPCGKEFRDYLGRRFCSLECKTGTELLRVCTDCGGIKPLTPEFFRSANYKGGSRRWFARTCHDCYRESLRRRRDEERARDPEAVRAYERQKYAKRSALYKGKVRRREALQRVTTVERVDMEAILADHGMVCHICGWDIPSPAEMDWDHVWPLARGGPHAADNLLPAHSTCNRWKAAHLMGELDLPKRREHMARKLGLSVAA